MNIRMIIALFIATLTVSGCNARDETKAVMILLSYEGTPRAHIPAVAWFAGKAIPRFAADSDHDNFWKQQYSATPKFALMTDTFTQVESLLNESSETESAYVIEFLFESERPKIRYLDLKDFVRVRAAFRELKIKGHEILAEWPTTGKWSNKPDQAADVDVRPK
jgi:hypothetical protein